MVGARLRLAVAATVVAGCAATGVTLRSNHYRVYVPPEWQVVEAGGDTVLPTLLKVPPPAGRAGPSAEVRLYTWIVQGPLADPSGEALQRLAAAGVLGLATAAAGAPCADAIGDVVVFGRPARALHFDASAGQRVGIAAGHDSGSLVAIVGIVAATPAACADAQAIDSAVARVAGAMAGDLDTTRPPTRPTILESPGGGRSIAIPGADPSPPAR